MTLYQGATDPVAIYYMARASIVERLVNTLADEHKDPNEVLWAKARRGPLARHTRELAETIVDSLVDHAVLFTSERWDEDCHVCEQRIGDHRVDGRCP